MQPLSTCKGTEPKRWPCKECSSKADEYSTDGDGIYEGGPAAKCGQMARLKLFAICLPQVS